MEKGILYTNRVVLVLVKRAQNKSAFLSEEEEEEEEEDNTYTTLTVVVVVTLLHALSLSKTLVVCEGGSKRVDFRSLSSSSLLFRVCKP